MAWQGHIPEVPFLPKQLWQLRVASKGKAPVFLGMWPLKMVHALVHGPTPKHMQAALSILSEFLEKHLKLGGRSDVRDRDESEEIK